MGTSKFRYLSFYIINTLGGFGDICGEVRNFYEYEHDFYTV